MRWPTGPKPAAAYVVAVGPEPWERLRPPPRWSQGPGAIEGPPLLAGRAAAEPPWPVLEGAVLRRPVADCQLPKLARAQQVQAWRPSSAGVVPPES